MKVRVILVCTLLLLAAVPSFALPNCRDCNALNRCQITETAIAECRWGPGFCETFVPTLGCNVSYSATVLTEWQVASIEISRPSLDSVTVTAPSEVAAAEVRTPEPAEQK